MIALWIDTGYAISLPYGADRDRVRNVLAAGSCILEPDGQRLDLTAPTVLAGSDGLALLHGPAGRDS